MENTMILLLLCFTYVFAEEKITNDAYKDQYCTDPRTMKRHSAYTEWADAYSCTRHRCQPGGRNLAIYTVGCKRVEAPESAIECEEVVEDTNMQFPYCCTRLRCLVVVRGEVWTKVLGQPWETLPAAPWSHMYKMKKPPPGNEFSPKVSSQGPIYELTDSDSEKSRDAKVMRATATKGESAYAVPRAPQSPDIVLTDSDWEKPRQAKMMRSTAAKAEPSYADASRAQQSPDIVIALTTNTNEKERNKPENTERKRRKQAMNQYTFEEEIPNEVRDRDDGEDATEKIETVNIKDWMKSHAPTESPQAQPMPGTIELSEEKEGRDSRDRDNQGNAREFASSYAYQNPKPKEQHQREWPDVPQIQWNEPDQDLPKEINYRQQDSSPPPEPPSKATGKSTHLQALVDAIGSRMRDIENVVQKMSEKVTVSVKQKTEQKSAEGSGERSLAQDSEQHGKYSQERKPKKQNAAGDQYKRFAVRNRGSKYLHGAVEGSTELPVFGGDAGYYSDASNSVLRRANPAIEPKEPEPAPTYMAPVENRRKAPSPLPNASEEKLNKKHRRRSHKKKKKNVRAHKKHHKEGEKKRKFNRANSVEKVENDRILISLEDSSATVNNA